MSIHRIELTDEWARRNLVICVRRAADLPIYARELAQYLARNHPAAPNEHLSN
jgi:hypothetical protein